MSTSSILRYIKEARNRDLSDRTIRENLLGAGWTEKEVDHAFSKDLPVPIPEGRGNVKQRNSGTMWDAFEHILLFISMYVLAISFGLALSMYIDRWVPGLPEGDYYQASQQLNMLKSTIAALIVSYPLFAFFFLRITRRTFQFPDIRNLKARKFLIYLTLVITFIIVIGNIISLVFNFLDGNVTLNFFLTFLVVVGISSIIFVYYLQQVKEDRIAYA